MCNNVKKRSPPPCRGMLSVIPKTLSLQHCLLPVQSYLSLVLSYKSSQRLQLMDNLLSSSINIIEIWSSSVSLSSMRNKEHHFYHSISRVQEVVVNLDLSNESLMLFCSPFHLKRGLHPQPRVMSLIQPARQSPKKTREYITTHRKIFKRKMTENCNAE